MGKVREKIEKVKKTIRKGVEKIQAFRKTPQGQQLESAAKKAAISFLRDSGLGKKANDRLNEEASKFTKGVEPLDDVRKMLHASVNNYFQSQQPLPTPRYNHDTPTVNFTRQNYQRATPRHGGRYTPRRR